jgi:hypothetical protein
MVGDPRNFLNKAFLKKVTEDHDQTLDRPERVETIDRSTSDTSIFKM